jgi:hypothetical protein
MILKRQKLGAFELTKEIGADGVEVHMSSPGRRETFDDLPRVRQTLDEMGWSGWLVVERSRDAHDTRNVKRNFSANTAYMKSIFQSK